jgi:hypothetical protein
MVIRCKRYIFNTSTDVISVKGSFNRNDCLQDAVTVYIFTHYKLKYILSTREGIYIRGCCLLFLYLLLSSGCSTVGIS